MLQFEVSTGHIGRVTKLSQSMSSYTSAQEHFTIKGEKCTGSLSEKINRANSLLENLKRQSRHISQLLYNVTHILEILCCENLHHCLICSFKETYWTQTLHREYKKKMTQFLKIFWLISKMDDGAVCIFGLIYGSAGVFSTTLRS